MKTDTSRFRFGMVGCGRVAREIHFPAWSTLPRANLVAVCDPSPTALEEVRRCYPEAHRLRELSGLLELKGQLDFVVLATPGIAHAADAERLLNAGFNVLCEKPLTLGADSARRLFALAERQGVTLCPIHNYRFKSNSLQALSLHRAGCLGDISLVNVQFRSGSLFDEPAHWMREERRHRALLFEIAYHFVDLALIFLGPLASMPALDADEDSMGLRYVTFTTLHQNGARGLFELMVDARCRSTEIELFGENGALSLQFFPDGFRALPGRDSPLHRMTGEMVRLAQFLAYAVRQKLLGGIPRQAMAHARLFAGFLDRVAGRGPVPVSPASAMLTIEVLDQVARRAYRMPASTGYFDAAPRPGEAPNGDHNPY